MQTNRRLQTLPLSLALALVLFPTSACPQNERNSATDAAATSDHTGGAAPKGAIQAIDDFIAAQRIDKSKSNWKTSLPKPPKLNFDPEATYLWQLDTTAGPIEIRLMPDVAPMHVSSTIYLSRLGFYDGLLFHRVIPRFMAQGGDPLGNGRGGPGYQYAGEFDRRVRHDRAGLLSMANAGPGTDGSQFFITFAPAPHLNGKHTIFGEVVRGMESVKELEKRRSPGSPAREEPLVIHKTRIEVRKKQPEGGTQ